MKTFEYTITVKQGDVVTIQAEGEDEAAAKDSGRDERKSALEKLIAGSERAIRQFRPYPNIKPSL